ncbi:MAG TPA: GNAT family N-acetyltransferase, partial [Phormidium sp.]
FRRDIASTVRLSNRIPMSKGRKACIGKGQRSNLQIQRSYDFETFMNIEEKHLKEKHSASPVHTSSEIQYLADSFPDNIKLFAACQGATMLGGVIVYESQSVAHAQYIAATEEGKRIGALDLLIDYLISRYYQVENPK